MKNEKLPYLYPYFPDEMKEFCVFIKVIGNKHMMCGSGVITKDGIYTAGHLFWFEWDIIYINKYGKHNELLTIVKTDLKFLSGEKDLAIIEFPVKSENLPIVEEPLYENELINSEYIAFGCPLGIFGLTWKPEILSVNDTFVLSKGVAIPGVSGGGLFIKTVDNKYYLWAIHVLGDYENSILTSNRLW